MKKSKALAVVLSVVLMAFLIMMMLPYAVMFVMTTHNNQEIFQGDILSVGDYLFRNLKAVFGMHYIRYFFNSLYIAVLSTALACLSSSMAAYSLTKFTYRGRDKIFVAVLIAMMIPGQLGLIAFINMMSRIGWVNTHLPFIIPSLNNTFGVFWFTMYMKGSVPKEIIESARIDGAHEIGIFFRIAIPFIKPAMVVFGFQSFLGSWNNFTVPSLILNRDELWTIPLAITKLGNMYQADYAARITGLAIATLPLVVILSFCSKYFTKGMVTGAIKG